MRPSNHEFAEAMAVSFKEGKNQFPFGPGGY